MNGKQKKTQSETKRRRLPDPAEAVLLLSPFLTGLFYLWGAALAVVGLTGALLLTQKREGLRFSFSPLLLACGSLVLFHLGGCLWGTDRGMALAGALQFLPLPLFALALQQREAEKRMQMLTWLPHTAAAMRPSGRLFPVSEHLRGVSAGSACCPAARGTRRPERKADPVAHPSIWACAGTEQGSGGASDRGADCLRRVR